MFSAEPVLPFQHKGEFCCGGVWQCEAGDILSQARETGKWIMKTFWELGNRFLNVGEGGSCRGVGGEWSPGGRMTEYLLLGVG
jgi:hypothetical protein